MNRRYLFLCPDRKSASGGIAVIYDLVALLNGSGYEAMVVHNSAAAGYPDYPGHVPLGFTDRINGVLWRHQGSALRKLREGAKWLGNRIRGGSLERLTLRDTDVIVTPELLVAEALEAFEGVPIVVFVQNPFSLMRSYDRAIARGFAPGRDVAFWCGIADVCMAHLDVLGADDVKVAYFPVTMKPEDFPYREEKADLIAYMPRKRPWEARIIDEALRRRGNLGRYRLEALDGIPRTEVAKKLAESRIFISLLQHEALGFPAAEAMSSGCIVVGFDGLGTAEYFDAASGIPVTEGDVAGLVRAVEETIAEYDRDPCRLDAIRRHASEQVHERYSVKAFQDGVLDAWRRIDKAIDPGHSRTDRPRR